MSTTESEYVKYIPLDKSWMIRMCLLDLVNGYSERAIKILDEQNDLGEDLIALKSVLRKWDIQEEIDVGESGTLFRFLQYISWKKGLNKKFIKHKTLKDRDICSDPEIVKLSQEELLKIDNKTSQWASASVICGDKERLDNPPFKLKLTYEALGEWLPDKAWRPRADETIGNQAKSFINLLKKQKMVFEPKQAEDYCFARAFDIVTKEEGQRMWPSLLGHESNRIDEMEKVLDSYQKDEYVDSRDHRVVQAVGMLGLYENKEVKILYKECVSKSWPKFWDFVDYCKTVMKN